MFSEQAGRSFPYSEMQLIFHSIHNNTDEENFQVVELFISKKDLCVCYDYIMNISLIRMQKFAFA